MAGGMCVREACVAVGACIAGGVHGKGACIAGGGMCMAGECAWQGGMCGRGGGMCGRGACMTGACMVGGVHCRGACVGGGMHAMHPPNPDTMRYGQSMRGRECILIYFNTFLLHWFASTVQQFHHDEKSCFASQGQGLLYLCFPG